MLFNPFRTRVGSSQQSTPSAPRAGTGRAIATVNAERIDLAASQARAYHIFVHAQCGPRHGPFQWSHEHRGVEMHRRDDNRSPWRHNGDATRWRHLKSMHSSNGPEHWQRPFDVVMTTQPNSHRRLAEAQGSLMRSEVCQRSTSPSSRTIEITRVDDVRLVRESRARLGPMHCDHLASSALPAEEGHPGLTGLVDTF